MNIGIFTDAYYPYISGVVTSVMTLEEELKALGHNVYIFTLANEEISNLHKDNVITFDGITVPTARLKAFKLSFRLRTKLKYVKKYNLDVIHLHTEFSMARLSVLASKKYNIPLVYTLHTLYEDYLQYISKTIDKYFHDNFLRSLATILLKKVNKRANIKIVPTRKTLSNVSKYCLDGNFRVIPTGLDLNKLISKKLDKEEILKFKESLNIPKDKLVLLSLGRISEEKSIDVLLRSMTKIDDSVILLVVGDGPYLAELKLLASDLGLDNDKVRFMGFVEWENIVPYYQVSDLFLNASKTETQGLTYIEALSLGTPILVQKDECLEDILIEGVNGYYFVDENELVQNLINIINNKDMILKLKDNTFSSVANYSKENYAFSCLQAYKDAISINNKGKIKFIHSKIY